jgi:hypothetical protein
MVQTIDPVIGSDERNLGMSAQLSAIFGGMFVPFGNLVLPLVIYLTSRDKRPFATQHAKATLNFQIAITIVTFSILATGISLFAVMFATALATPGSSMKSPICSFAFGSYAVTILTGCVIGVWAIVWTVLGAIATSKGRSYRYPLTFDFVK